MAPGLYAYAIGYDIIGKSVHVVSEGGPAVTTIANHGMPPSPWESGSYAFRITSVPGPCTISGFTMSYHILGDMAMNNYTIMIMDSNVRITGNVFANNRPHVVVYVTGSSAPLIDDNVFAANTATSIYIGNGASPTIERNTFADNIWYEQIAITGVSSHPIIRHNIIVNGKLLNDCTPSEYCYSYGVNAFTPAENIVFECNNVWNNATGNYGGELTDQTGINGNISMDPLFCGIAGSGNFYLQSSSPCAAANVPAECAGQRMGCFPASCTVGTKDDSWGSIKSLFGNRQGDREAKGLDGQ